jgi:sulfur carrier protein
VSTKHASIRIKINGEDHLISGGMTLGGLLVSLAVDRERVAVELDRRIVKQPQWDRTELHAGAEVEIVQFVGGG